jgi:LPXTG-site transpeptidase (sortase) family protein
MNEPNQTFPPAGIIFKKRLLSLSWNIATDPKLYWELAPNPYSSKAQQIILERFPDESIPDSMIAVILAEPEGKYDRNFRQLGTAAQAEELRRQRDVTIEVNKRLAHYCKEHKKELSRLPKDVLYNILSINVFELADIKIIEERYSQNQRQNFKFSIVNFIEDTITGKPPPKKPFRKRPFVLGGFALLSLVLLFFVTQQQIQNAAQYHIKKQVLASETQDKNEGFPMRLEIPSINVNAAVEYVGITPKGAMDVPINTIDVGLFKYGAYPGENGSAVIAGHYDSVTGAPGVFANLNKLKRGDKVYIDYANGISLTFLVRDSHMYVPGYADDVFGGKTGVHLNLITCDGVWDADKKSYTKRLVVFTDITH